MHDVPHAQTHLKVIHKCQRPAFTDQSLLVPVLIKVGNVHSGNSYEISIKLLSF